MGDQLAGGTIEGMAPDAWFELQFTDGSTVMISGFSMLTFSDDGQKSFGLRRRLYGQRDAATEGQADVGPDTDGLV